MRVAKVLSTSITAAALAFSMLASAIPAAGVGGYNASYFSESSFLSLAPGQTGQFAVGFSNTGTQAWTKGSAAAQASLYTRNGSTALSDQGWAVNWPAPNIYAHQANDLVAPGQVGFFIYNLQVPAAQPQGVVTFSGIPWGGGNPMEDYGYYQDVNVTSSALKITGSTPTSPSTNATPTISGSGATATTTVTVAEGSTTLCTATASSTGTFSCVTSALSAGSHSITATAPGQGTSAVFTYVVDTSAPALVSADTNGGLQRLNVCYNKAMAVTGPNSIIDARNYSGSLSPATVNLAGGSTVVNDVIASSDGKCALFLLAGTNQLLDDTSYTLTVSNVADAAGNKIPASSSVSFSTADASSPTATGITQPGTREIIVNFNEPIASGTAVAANFKWDSASFPGTLYLRVGTSSYGQQVRLTFATGGAPVSVSTGTHTLDISGVTDLGGNTISPNPTSFTVTIADDSTRPTITSASASRIDFGGSTGYREFVTVNYSEAMQGTGATGGGWATTNAINTVGNYSLFNPDGSNATTGCSSGNGTAIGAPSAASFSDTATSRFELKTVRLTFDVMFGSGCQYTLQVTNVQDQAGNTTGGGNALNPNPTLVTVSDTQDTTAPTVVSATASLTQLNVCYSETMSSSVVAGTYSNTTASTVGNYTSSGSALGTSLGAATYSAISDDGKCIVLNFGTNLTAGTYTLTVSGVTDPAGNAVSPNPTTISVTFSDSTSPSLTSATLTSGNVMTVVFSKGMTGGASPSNSAGNPNNYSLSNSTYGNVCGLGTATIAASVSNTTWTITCSSSSGVPYLTGVNPVTALPTGGAGTGVLTVKNVADSNGNVISPNPASDPF